MRETNDQRGLAMPEAMMAVLLFSVVALSTLHYLQNLQHHQEDQRQFRLALDIAHQSLECYPWPGLAASIALPAGWQLALIERPRAQECARVSAQVHTAGGRRVTLNRWFCRVAHCAERKKTPNRNREDDRLFSAPIPLECRHNANPSRLPGRQLSR
ncbi:prepilin-type N-terminal cleavage/methylation domain-containing protein [Acerihabitans sp. TG2]|uniref:prepilin-type N-terminal cleavage/methylation domain-containing protein n=1 Tax=Acerihabitans sp. TG2 TaxID=3096008 RepID=UPI002B22C9F2|nr:prepilin-type N-terminal cleavage/methylation domain-containing protein [Acerihabitans sp. TG2]MEA9392511.1 prepilin-type N-terminal cleavage/methylation domain-containing protein [Acerihabitans sp. TG2]